jgi:hypothetical protein
MARDPLAVLARLRARERDAARQAMAVANAALRQAEAMRDDAAAELRREAASATADFAAWLPAAFARRASASQGMTRAAAEAEVARQALVMARAAAEAVTNLLGSRRRARREARLAADQRLLDDLPR